MNDYDNFKNEMQDKVNNLIVDFNEKIPVIVADMAKKLKNFRLTGIRCFFDHYEFEGDDFEIVPTDKFKNLIKKSFYEIDSMIEWIGQIDIATDLWRPKNITDEEIVIFQQITDLCVWLNTIEIEHDIYHIELK